MIEAMACGTPVLAFRHGSVSEVVEDGITGDLHCAFAHSVAAQHPKRLAIRDEVAKTVLASINYRTCSTIEGQHRS